MSWIGSHVRTSVRGCDVQHIDLWTYKIEASFFARDNPKPVHYTYLTTDPGSISGMPAGDKIRLHGFIDDFILTSAFGPRRRYRDSRYRNYPPCIEEHEVLKHVRAWRGQDRRMTPVKCYPMMR